MISFHLPEGRFNLRAAGILFHEGKLLLQRIPSQEGSSYFFPGGRAEFGEDAAQTLVREMREELGAETRIERLLFITESFLPANGIANRHDIVFYFLLSCDDPALFAHGETFEIVDSGMKFEFRWLPLVEIKEHKHAPLFPPFLQTRIFDLPATVEHIVLR